MKTALIIIFILVPNILYIVFGAYLIDKDRKPLTAEGYIWGVVGSATTVYFIWTAYLL